MKTNRIRALIPLCILVLAFIGFVANIAFGTLSSFGIEDIALICPLGALATMIATKTIIPRAVVSVVIAALFILVLGRAFCGWMCPVPLVEKLRGAFAKGERAADEEAQGEPKSVLEAEAAEGVLASCEGSCGAAGASSCASCAASCLSKRGDKVDSRHIVLAVALVSTLIFGFPVFCVICPVGLTFGTLFLFVSLFAQGDLSWATVVIPLILLIEVVFFKKWCHTFCPLGALFSLVGKGNKTFVPVVAEEKCLESVKGAECGICAKVCPEGIDPRHMDLSTTSMCECTKCRQCVEKCPGRAISMPLLNSSVARLKRTEDKK